MFPFRIQELFICSILLLQLSGLVFAGTTNTSAPAQPPGNNANWTGWGGNVYNNRWAAENTEINSTTLGDLVLNCKLDYPIGVSATPVVLNNTAYYPTSNGSFYALNIGTCKYVWELNVTAICYDFAPLTASQENNTLPISRTSPQIDGDVLYFGTQAHALMVAVDVITGDVLATTQVADHPMAILTMSPTVYNGKIFIGASSQESSASVDPGFKCCSFIGSFQTYTFDLTSNKFTQLWTVTTLPAGQGWAGAGIWGSQPAIDPTRNQVFVGTGNLYVYPDEWEKCINQTASCLPDNVWQDSVLALDIDTGKLNWRQSITPLDGWLMVCGYAGAPKSNSPLCPDRPGPDADFGMAPTFVPAALGDGTTGVDSIVVGQKSGNLYSINAETGDITWKIATGPDENGDGLSWGVAVDDKQVYFTMMNLGSENLTLSPSGAAINNSAYGAVSLKTGEYNWETPCPAYQTAYSPPGVVNDIVLVGQSGSSTEKIPGAVHALLKTTGAIIHTWPVESVQHGGIMASGGFVMFGTGYHYTNPFMSGSFYVYGLPDAIKQAKIVPPKQNTTITNIGDAGNNIAHGTSGNVVGEGGKVGSSKKSAANRMGSDLLFMAVYPVALFTVFTVWLG